MNIRFPNESADYRAARDELLKAEDALRRQVEAVAALRRTLPLGGAPPEDYAFEERGPSGVRSTRLSELFQPGHEALFLYSYMYGPQMPEPCPLCTSFLDGLEAQAEHLGQQISVAVVAKSPLDRLLAFTDARGWRKLRLLSSAANTYHRDYLGETPAGGQLPMANVFVRRDEEVRHVWGSELLFADSDFDSRHIDLLWPLWNVLDLTPQGRGDSWYPDLAYPPKA